MRDDPDHYWSTAYDEGKDYASIPSRMLSHIVESLNATLPRTCLDIGCGTGQLTRELYHRGYDCTGVDMSASAIRLANANTIFSDGLRYLQGDAEKLDKIALHPPYSLITCKLVLAFIKDKDAFLKKVYSLLVDEGSFVIITPVDSQDRPAISVDFEATLRRLETYFSTVDHFVGRRVTYFVCRKWPAFEDLQ